MRFQRSGYEASRHVHGQRHQSATRRRRGPTARGAPCTTGASSQKTEHQSWRTATVQKTNASSIGRCGWAWVRLGGDDMGIFEDKCGPLRGRRQTNSRAEVRALLDCLKSIAGPLPFWTVSEIAFKGWASRFGRPADAGAIGDLWKEIGRELHRRGPADE
eukprot:1587792-Pyramimonas_sp.AAC.1